MAPRKPTTPQADNPHELILSYLTAQNRPYSSTEISANLHNKVTKTKADKFLKEMHEKNEIGGKIGKQSVFWALQGSDPVATPEELSLLDTSIKDLQLRLPTLKINLKTHTATLAALQSAPTTSGIREAVEEMQKKKEEIENRLRDLRSGGQRPVSKEEKDKLAKDFRIWEVKTSQRKNMYLELEGMLMDAGMERKDIRENFGIDADP